MYSIIYINEHQGTENGTQQNRQLWKPPPGHQQKTNHPFKQKCQLQERNARDARQKKKVYSSYDPYYHNDNSTARMPTHNHNLYLKHLLEYHNTEHDYKVLRVKQGMKEENEMLQNEMPRLREVRKNHRLEDYAANVQNMKQRIDEYKQWLRGDTQDCNIEI